MNATKLFFVVCLLVFSTVAFAQDSIPSGTILPVQLNSSLSSKTRPGKIITGRIMQDISLSDGEKMREGARVVGHVIAVHQADGAASARVVFTFDKLVVSKKTISITTSLRAVASSAEVENAQLPETVPEGLPQDAWTTVQVGGDVVYRGGGPVKEGSETVGTPVYDGVLTRVRNVPGCSDQVDDNGRPQALWVFSADACGAYGFPDVTITHAGWSKPLGEISLGASRGNPGIPSGSGLLLRVMSTGKNTT